MRLESFILIGSTIFPRKELFSHAEEGISYGWMRMIGRPADLERFKALKQNLDPAVDSVCMDYYLAFDPLGKPTAVVKRNRLVKRSRQFQWRDPVHEHLEVEGNIMLSDIAVSHGRVHTDSGRNLRIYEAHLAKGGTLSKRQHYAMELSASAYYDKAIEIYETIIHDPVSYFEENWMRVAWRIVTTSWDKRTRTAIPVKDV